MSEDITLEAEKKKYLGKEATEKLIKNIKSKVNNALADKVSFNEQTLTNEQQEQVRKNIGVMQADHAQNDKYAVDYIKNRLAYTEENLITVCFGDVDNSQFTVSDVGFSHVSDLVPTKEQLVGNMRFYLVDQFGEESESHDLYIKEAIFDDDMVYGGALYYGNDILSGMYVSVAYKSGVWNGMEIPKTGLFIHKPDLGEADPNAYFELKYEAVHGVDPKYLPEGGFGYYSGYKYVTVLDDKMTLTGNTPGANSQWSGAGTSLIEVGKTYRVTLDGGREYECVCRRYNKGIDNDVSDFRFLGDLSGLGHEGYGDEDKPFLFFEAHSNSFGIIQQCFDDAGGLTIKIEERQRDIHLIDPKFLPEGGVGYTEGVKYDVLYKDVPLAESDTDPGTFYNFDEPFLKEGDVYRVTLDGSLEYECKCETIYLLDGRAVLCVGNLDYFNILPPTGRTEPFVLAQIVEGTETLCQLWAFNDAGTAKSATIAIKREKIRGIDPKFLPEGGFGHIGKEGYVKVLDSSDFGDRIPTGDAAAVANTYDKTILKEGHRYRISYGENKCELTCARITNEISDILHIGSVEDGIHVYEGFSDGQQVKMIEAGADRIDSIVIEEWQSEVHKIDPMFIPDDFGGYWFDDINFLYALLGTGGQAGKLEYTLAPAVYDSMAKAIQDGTFKGVLFSMDGQTRRLLADTGLSYLNGVYEFVLNVPTGITDEHMTYDKIVVRLIEDGTVLVDYVDDERDIVIDMTDIFQEEVVLYRLYAERAQLLDHFAKKHRSITCAVDIGEYIRNVTLTYSNSEYSTQYVGSFQGYIFVITFADGAWEAVKLREGVGILETSLPKDGSKVMLSEKDILYLTGAMEMNAMGPINVYINVEGEGACIAPMKIYHHMDGSEIMCVETSTKRCFIGETEEGVYAWAEDLYPDYIATKDDIEEVKEYAESLQIAGDKITEFDIPIQNEKVQCPVPREELIGMKVRTEVNAYRFNSAPVKPDSDEEIVVVNARGENVGVGIVGYHDISGGIDKKALVIELVPTDAYMDLRGVMYSMCPAFSDVYAGYNGLVYFFERTSDTMGLGLVVEPGWYAANSETFAMTPFDIEKYPIRIFDDMIADGEVSVDEYFYQATTHEGAETITLTEDNFDEERVFVSLSPISETVYEYLESLISGKLYEEVVKFQRRYNLFNLEEDGWIFVNSPTIVGDKTYGSKKTTLLINSIQKVDPKYLPDTIATKEDVTAAVAEAKAYTDKKAGYTETETIYNAKNLALPAGSHKNIFDFTSPIVEGESYIVNLNGVEYEYICVLNSSGAPCLGNIAATGDGNSVNNGEPVGVKFRATGKYIVATIDTSVDRTISVYQRTETIHPIDPKYLPKMVDIWEAEDVIPERDIDTAFDTAPGTHSLTISYNFSEILSRLKSAVESGGTFMAAFPYGKLLPVCYSDTQICFTYWYDNVRIDIVCKDGVVTFYSQKATA